MIRVIYNALYNFFNRLFLRLPLSDNKKEQYASWISYFLRRLRKIIGLSLNKEKINNKVINRKKIASQYIQQILSLPNERSYYYVNFNQVSYKREFTDPKLIAYYLTQYHPIQENDEWWGRGTTEWNNVSKAVPQYVGHYQPRLPGELGYYDLRVKDNFFRQIELAKCYGIYGFSFYYYWFDGRRLLERPFNDFLENNDLNFPFCICWANESWTRRFDGSCGEVLVFQSDTAESYRNFIHDTVYLFNDYRYIRCNGRPVIIIYRPSFVPDCLNTLEYWRQYCQKTCNNNPYIIGVKEHTFDGNLIDMGFDAISEFHPGTIFKYCSIITDHIHFVRKNFGGIILDYQDIVNNKKYFKYNHYKLYRSVMPMWDNTPRRNNMGMIFHGSNPELYKTWLKDIIVETKLNHQLDDNYIFINAWNEWGEGAYLEPDKMYGYAYLQATRQAIEEVRDTFRV